MAGRLAGFLSQVKLVGLQGAAHQPFAKAPHGMHGQLLRVLGQRGKQDATDQGRHLPLHDNRRPSWRQLLELPVGQGPRRVRAGCAPRHGGQHLRHAGQVQEGIHEPRKGGVGPVLIGNRGADDHWLPRKAPTSEQRPQRLLITGRKRKLPQPGFAQRQPFRVGGQPRYYSIEGFGRNYRKAGHGHAGGPQAAQAVGLASQGLVGGKPVVG